MLHLLVLFCLSPFTSHERVILIDSKHVSQTEMGSLHMTSLPCDGVVPNVDGRQEVIFC